MRLALDQPALSALAPTPEPSDPSIQKASQVLENQLLQPFFLVSP